MTTIGDLKRMQLADDVEIVVAERGNDTRYVPKYVRASVEKITVQQCGNELLDSWRMGSRAQPKNEKMVLLIR